MLSDRDIQAVVRILSHCDELGRDLEAVRSLEYLRGNKMACRSMAMLLVRIGVVVEGEVSTKLRDTYSDIPWGELESVHDVLFVEFAGPKPDVIWRFATETLPPVKTKLEAILDREMKS